MECELERLNIELFKLVDAYGYITENIPLNVTKNKTIKIVCKKGHEVDSNLNQILKTKRCMRCEKVSKYYEILEMIENICLKKHYEYGLGIVMTEDIHILFHKVYGTRNNNYEQVLEFKKDYLLGKYDDVKGT